VCLINRLIAASSVPGASMDISMKLLLWSAFFFFRRYSSPSGPSTIVAISL
jgi:hypothetical protein